MSEPSSSWPWWATALLAAVVAMILLTVSFFIGEWQGYVVVGVGIAVFVIILIHNPAFWIRQLAGTCIGISGALVLAPMLWGNVNFGAFGKLIIETGIANPLIIPLFLAAGIALVVIEVWREKREPEKAGSEGAPGIKASDLRSDEGGIKATDRTGKGIALERVDVKKSIRLKTTGPTDDEGKKK